MTNVECPMTRRIQMTNQQTTKEHPRGISSFVLRHSFGIRHLSFFISSAGRLVLVLLITLCVSCSGKRISKENVDQVVEGMSKKQVESILGPPTELDNKDFVIMKKTTYVSGRARTRGRSFSKTTKAQKSRAR